MRMSRPCCCATNYYCYCSRTLPVTNNQYSGHTLCIPITNKQVGRICQKHLSQHFKALKDKQTHAFKLSNEATATSTPTVVKDGVFVLAPPESEGTKTHRQKTSCSKCKYYHVFKRRRLSKSYHQLSPRKRKKIRTDLAEFLKTMNIDPGHLSMDFLGLNRSDKTINNPFSVFEMLKFTLDYSISDRVYRAIRHLLRLQYELPPLNQLKQYRTSLKKFICDTLQIQCDDDGTVHVDISKVIQEFAAVLKPVGPEMFWKVVIDGRLAIRQHQVEITISPVNAPKSWEHSHSKIVCPLCLWRGEESTNEYCLHTGSLPRDLQSINGSTIKVNDRNVKLVILHCSDLKSARANLGPHVIIPPTSLPTKSHKCRCLFCDTNNLGVCENPLSLADFPNACLKFDLNDCVLCHLHCCLRTADARIHAFTKLFLQGKENSRVSWLPPLPGCDKPPTRKQAWQDFCKRISLPKPRKYANGTEKYWLTHKDAKKLMEAENQLNAIEFAPDDDTSDKTIWKDLYKYQNDFAAGIIPVESAKIQGQALAERFRKYNINCFRVYQHMYCLHPDRIMENCRNKPLIFFHNESQEHQHKVEHNIFLRKLFLGTRTGQQAATYLKDVVVQHYLSLFVTYLPNKLPQPDIIAWRQRKTKLDCNIIQNFS